MARRLRDKDIFPGAILKTAHGMLVRVVGRAERGWRKVIKCVTETGHRIETQPDTDDDVPSLQPLNILERIALADEIDAMGGWPKPKRTRRTKAYGKTSP